MNPLTPLLVTICLLSPGCYLLVYCNHYVRMARRPDAARVRVCEWFIWWMAWLGLVLGALQLLTHLTRHLQKAGPYLWLGWPVLVVAVAGALIARQKYARKVKKKYQRDR
jgi:hypothetical protein